VAGDLILYQFSRWKVEQGFFSHFLSAYDFDKLPEGPRLREMLGSLVLCVDGYDREQVAVPLCFHLEHRPPTFLVEERDALYQPGEAFNWSLSVVALGRTGKVRLP
jgi:hypothetical protein